LQGEALDFIGSVIYLPPTRMTQDT